MHLVLGKSEDKTSKKRDCREPLERESLGEVRKKQENFNGKGRNSDEEIQVDTLSRGEKDSLETLSVVFIAVFAVI